VNVSVPGSVTVAVRLSAVPSGLLTGAPTMETVGATFTTVISFVPAFSCVPSSSTRSTVIVNGSDGVPLAG